jgi:biofilm protein TabA
MIVDRLDRRALYESLAPGIALGLEYLHRFDPAVADGRVAIDGDRVVAIVQSYDTAPATEKQFETHRRHLDIQYVLSGRERILYIPAAGLEVEAPYDEERDVEFYHDPPASTSVLLCAGDFAIFHPHDAHKPGCMAGGRDEVRKIVVKVRVA